MDSTDHIEFINELVESFNICISMKWKEIIAETENYESIPLSHLKYLSEIASNVGFTLESSTITDDKLQLYFQSDLNKEPVKEKSQENELLTLENRYNLIKEIREKRRWFNNLFRLKFDIKFLKDSEPIMDLMGECKNEIEFNTRILVLTHIINNINHEKLKKKFETRGKSINFLKFILDEHCPHYDVKIIKNLRDIMNLRSDKYPIHTDNPEFLDVLNRWGFSFPPNWNKLYILALEKYLETIEELIDLFS